MSTRIAGYRYTGTFRESTLERILERAQESGVVTEYDTGRGRIVWFNGHPGPELREVRREILKHISWARPLR